jgi:hypothetical protein
MVAVPNLDSCLKKTTVLPRLVDDSKAQTLLRIASAADLRRLARKSADSEAVQIPEARFTVKPGHTYILLVTLGAGELWGGNENADFYPEKTGYTVTFPEPGIGCPSRLVMGKGLAETHKTFAKYGAVYRNHKTEPVDHVPRSGEIVFERWRPDMHWGELIVELPNDKWAKELDAFDHGTPLLWSQGSGVPADYCVRCGFRYDKDTKSRCRHILLNKLCIPEDGIQNVILCADSTFYDISYVGNNPAAKIAWGLLKVASCDGDPDTVGSWRPVVPIFNRHSELRRIRTIRPLEPAFRSLCAAEDSIQPGEAEAFRNTCSLDPRLDLDFVDTCRAVDPQDLINALPRTGAILTPTQWWRIFSPDSGEPSSVSGFTSALRDVYGRARAETDGDFTEDAAWLPQGCPDIAVLNRLQPFSKLLTPRPEIKLTIVVKQARSEPAVEASVRDRFLAREYARYQTACVAEYGKPYTSRWCALANAAAI